MRGGNAATPRHPVPKRRFCVPLRAHSCRVPELNPLWPTTGLRGPKVVRGESAPAGRLAEAELLELLDGAAHVRQDLRLWGRRADPTAQTPQGPLEGRAALAQREDA